MKKSMLIALAAVVAVSLAACSSVAQKPLSDLEPLTSGEPIVSSAPTASEPVRTGELSYSDLTDEHKTLFDEIAPMLDEPVKLGNMSAEDASKELDNLISNLAATGELPSNAVDLFHQYRDEMGITFPEPEPQPEVVLNDGTTSQPVEISQSQPQTDISDQPQSGEIPQEIQADNNGNQLYFPAEDDEEGQRRLQEAIADFEADGYYDGYAGIFPSPEEQREMDISAGGDGNGSTLVFAPYFWGIPYEP